MFCTDCGSWNRAEAARCLRCGIHMPEGGENRQSPPDASVTALRQVTGGRYTIMHRVGEGGMASVYYAVNVCLDSPVVIKVLHPHLARRSEEHTSELQSRLHLVCRLLLEKKKIHILLPSSNLVRHVYFRD